MKIRIHYNKQGVNKGFPWTVHTSKGCFPASHIKVTIPCNTEEKPNKKDNPRYFIVCDGVVTWEDTVAVIKKNVK